MYGFFITIDALVVLKGKGNKSMLTIGLGLAFLLQFLANILSISLT